jgi:hypothetical protein
LSACSPNPRQCQIRDRTGGVEPRENIPQLYRMFDNDATRVVALVKALQPLVADRADHIEP